MRLETLETKISQIIYGEFDPKKQEIGKFTPKKRNVIYFTSLPVESGVEVAGICTWFQLRRRRDSDAVFWIFISDAETAEGFQFLSLQGNRFKHRLFLCCIIEIHVYIRVSLSVMH